MAPVAPMVQWAQHQEEVLVTVQQRDVDAATAVCEYTATGMHFKGTSKNGDEKEFSIDFFADVVPVESKHAVLASRVVFILAKGAGSGLWWVDWIA